MPSREDLSAAVDSCACFQLRRASRAVTQLYDTALQPTGLRSTQFVILAVTRVEEPVTQPALATALGMDRTTLSRNLKPLETDGYLRRTRKRGERATIVSLTPKGRRKLIAAVPYWEEVQSSFTSGLGKSHWNELRQRLQDASAVARKR
ncbi:MAG: MarR family winged helix-turn-helix transcriptional regulator [Planctomycetota bacterium]